MAGEGNPGPTCQTRAPLFVWDGTTPVFPMSSAGIVGRDADSAGTSPQLDNEFKVPGIAFKKEIEFEHLPIKPILLGPVKIRIEGAISLSGSARYRKAKSTITFSGDEHGAGKAEVAFTQELEDCFIKEVKLKGEIEPGKLSSVAMEFGTEYFNFEFGANANLRKPFHLKFEKKLLHKKVELLETEFEGEIAIGIVFCFTANEIWWAKQAAKTAAARTAATEAGEAVTAEATGGLLAGTAGAVVVAAAVAAAFVAWIGFGLYMINKAHRDGREEAVGNAFSTGYARMLAAATSAGPAVQGSAEFNRLLDLDWKYVLAEEGKIYVESTGAFGANLIAHIEDAGAAAVFQDVMEYLRQRGPESWEQVRKYHQATYGASQMTRRHRYFWILYEQMKHGGMVGIDLMKCG
jgi:hypothetical protein